MSKSFSFYSARETGHRPRRIVHHNGLLFLCIIGLLSHVRPGPNGLAAGAALR